MKRRNDKVSDYSVSEFNFRKLAAAPAASVIPTPEFDTAQAGGLFTVQDEVKKPVKKTSLFQRLNALKKADKSKAPVQSKVTFDLKTVGSIREREEDSTIANKKLASTSKDASLNALHTFQENTEELLILPYAPPLEIDINSMFASISLKDTDSQAAAPLEFIPQVQSVASTVTELTATPTLSADASPLSSVELSGEDSLL